jgi:hypothetical protein
LQLFCNMGRPLFRKGVTGALLDVYQEAVHDFSVVASMLPEEAFIDPDSCMYENKVTLHYIITHTIASGYIYADLIRELWQLPTQTPAYEIHNAGDVSVHLNHMFKYTEEALQDTFLSSHHHVKEMLITSSWGTVYDLEMMLEHAIVHIYRHKRQLKKFLSSR